MVVWTSAWLHGAAAADDVLDALHSWAESHEVTAHDESTAVKKFQANLKKHAGITGVPDYGTYTAYIICDLAIQGLQAAGKTPTRQSFVDTRPPGR